MLDNYIINNSTLALLPAGDKKTKVIEKYVNYLVKGNPLTIVDESCKFYGSSYKGRCQSARYLLGDSYKCPIIISEVKDILIFPTSSGKKADCMWFAYNGIVDYFVNDNKNLTIILNNGKKISTDLSANHFSNQLFKATRLMTIMKGKKC